MPEQLHQTSDILTTTKKNEKKMKKTGKNYLDKDTNIW